MAKQKPVDIHDTSADNLSARGVSLSLHALSYLPYLDYGTVVHCVPLHRVYHVQPYRGGPIRMCKLLTRGPTGLIGPYDADTIPPLTPVWFINVPDSQYGYIIGCEPPYLTSGNQYYGDAIVRDAKVGLDEEQEYQLVYRVGSQIPAFSGRTPVDSVETGEFCRIAETGTMLFLDSFMAMLRAGDTCGVTAHFPNKLLRLMGRHLQQWTPISGNEHYVSPQGLSVVINGVANNVVEGLGVFQDITNYDPEKPPNPNGISTSGRPVYRDLTLSGGIVDGEAKWILGVDEGVNRAEYGYSVEYPLSLVYRSYTGQLIQASCSGIHFIKTNKMLGLVPTQPITSSPDTEHPQDASGPVNILSTGNPKVDADVKSLNILDMHYLLLRTYIGQGNQKESAFSILQGRGGADPTSFSEISADTTLARPFAAYKVYRDPANRMFAISENTGYIGILDDGSVCLSDGWGAEIRLSRGCAYITAPLDIYLDSGRNIVQLAGRDAIFKAYKDMDLSTSAGDMRLKAEHNLHMLGANAGDTYGVLIESRSSLASGYQEGLGTAARYPGINLVANTSNVILKAENVASWAANAIIDAAPSGILIRSGEKIVDQTSCVIAQIFAYNQHDRSYKEIENCEELGNAGQYYLGPRYNLFTYQSTVLGGELLVKGDVAIYNDVVAGGHAYVAGDILIDSQFARNMRQSLPLTGSSLFANVSFDVGGSILGQLPTYAANLFFTCRVDADYQNNDFTYPEGRWTTVQQAIWPEPSVDVEFINVNCSKKSGSGSSGSSSSGTTSARKPRQQTWPFPGARYYGKKAPRIIIRSKPRLDANMSGGKYNPPIQIVTMHEKKRLG
jgi:hypothetical protein